ncbi:MAG: serine--tRNA ligase [Candidatus Marinimicrobia bacterium]|jgi:seryl-tRNA synthetase|nr:serine--tRNA ligase [Candidatus Neomarinimicrobiota bacterium]MBT3618519.1 serine--tRNA ligase [Candidatus Neomarinimicrobiota bacterium]MBT3828925.1 serine--tRNA ligase [Candidatus Neomarinimicrobiota bacterium]MBT3997309.1 serine--tRNA ligase [Candidatus Neomarinimicrobiota bacterium]MBT4281169.1 serine--tRNA ligase [Candidatus Neomarinimicrobiota bacterium]
MIPISILRDNPDAVKKSLESKGAKINLELILKLDQDLRSIITKLDGLRAKKNKVSETIAELKRNGENPEEDIQAMQTLGTKIDHLESSLQEIKSELNTQLIDIPNLPDETVPIGKDPSQNRVVREWGKKPDPDKKYQTHLEIGKNLNILDMDRGAKISGSGFPLYLGEGARLERTLINFMLDHHESSGYTEVFPPFLTQSSAPMTCGQLPKFADDMYTTEDGNLWLIPTAEVPLTNIHKDEILEEESLPKYYKAYSACFRREAGSYGKDTRGLLRVHQFNKVELVKFVLPETSYNELESLTLQAESVLQTLNLHYRVVELCTGDLSFSAAKCYDIEIWAPGENRWLEVSSCSNFESFQARRGNIRYRRSSDNKVDYLHTLNGSGVATPRLMVALLETYQTEDGTVQLPDALISYMGKEVIS